MGKRRHVCLLCLVALAVTSVVIVGRHLRSAFFAQSPSQCQFLDELSCGCPRCARGDENRTQDTLCSEWSTNRGSGQNVVSYAIYGTQNYSTRLYYNQVEDRLKDVRQYYKGFVVRLYFNSEEGSPEFLKLVCDLYCKYDFFDPCDVSVLFPPPSWNDTITETSGRLHGSRAAVITNAISMAGTQGHKDRGSPAKSNDVKGGGVPQKGSLKGRKDGARNFASLLVGKMWRFLVMGDPLVSVFLVRDLDSFILPREADAVNQWMHNSTALIHGMRDHPSHNGVLLAGLWGGARFRDEKKLTSVLQRMVSWPSRNLWDYDQILLRRDLWPEVLDSVLIHDSYHCKNALLASNLPTQPFPTKRSGKLFVSWGKHRSKTEIRDIVPCPLQCRPRDHLDWLYC